MLSLTTELFPCHNVVFCPWGQQSQSQTGADLILMSYESRTRWETDPAALFDPVAEPPVAKSRTAHVEHEKGQDEKTDQRATRCRHVHPVDGPGHRAPPTLLNLHQLTCVMGKRRTGRQTVTHGQ